MPRRWLVRLTWLALLAALVTGAVLLKAASEQGLAALQADVTQATPLFIAVRLLLIAALVAAWPTVLRCSRERQWITSDAHASLLAARWRIAAWLIALELILGLQALNHLHSLIAGLLT